MIQQKMNMKDKRNKKKVRYIFYFLLFYVKINMVKNMSLRFIYGKSGTGKTSFCFKETKVRETEDREP